MGLKSRLESSEWTSQSASVQQCTGFPSCLILVQQNVLDGSHTQNIFLAWFPILGTRFDTAARMFLKPIFHQKMIRDSLLSNFVETVTRARSLQSLSRHGKREIDAGNFVRAKAVCGIILRANSRQGVVCVPLSTEMKAEAASVQADNRCTGISVNIDVWLKYWNNHRVPFHWQIGSSKEVPLRWEYQMRWSLHYFAAFEKGAK